MTRAWILGLLGLCVATGVFVGDAAWRVALAPDGSGADIEPLAAELAREGIATTRLQATYLALPDADVGVLVVSAAPRAPTDDESRALQAFARTRPVVVLGDSPAAEALGMQIVGIPLAQSDAGPLRAHATDGQTVLLPDAHAVLGAGAPWLLTSNATFADVDGDARATAADVPGPFVVARREGNVVVVGASLGEVSLADAPTRALVAALFAELAPPGTRVALDASRGGEAPWADALLAAPQDVAAQPALGAAVIAGLAFAAWAAVSRALRSTRDAEDDPEAPVPLEGVA